MLSKAPRFDKATEHILERKPGTDYESSRVVCIPSLAGGLSLSYSEARLAPLGAPTACAPTPPNRADRKKRGSKRVTKRRQAATLQMKTLPGLRFA